MFNWLTVFINDFKIYLKDWQGWLLNLLTPIIVISIAGIGLSGFISGGSSNKAIEIGIINFDSGNISAQIIDGLSKFDKVKVKVIPDDLQQKYLKEGAMPIILMFPDDLSKNINKFAANKDNPDKGKIQIFFDITASRQLSVVKEILNKIITQYSIDTAIKDVLLESKNSADENFITNFKNKISSFFEKNPFSIDVIPMGSMSNSGNSFDFFIPGYAIMFLLFGVLSGGLALLKEKESGTLSRLLIAPVSKASILSGKMITTVVEGVLQLCLLFVFGYLVYHISVGSNVLSLFILIVVVSLACTSLGVLIASLAQTLKQAQSMSVIIVLVMSSLGGSWFPLSMMPPFVRKIAHLTINAWAMDAFTKLLSSQPFSSIFLEIFILLGMTLFFFTSGLIILRLKKVV